MKVHEKMSKGNVTGEDTRESEEGRTSKVLTPEGIYDLLYNQLSCSTSLIHFMVSFVRGCNNNILHACTCTRTLKILDVANRILLCC